MNIGRLIATSAKMSRKKSSLHKSWFTRWNMLAFLEMKWLSNIMVAFSPVNFGAGDSISFWQQIILQLSTHSVLQSFQVLTLKPCPKQRIANFVSKDLKGWCLQNCAECLRERSGPQDAHQPEAATTATPDFIRDECKWSAGWHLVISKAQSRFNRLWIVRGAIIQRLAGGRHSTWERKSS